MEYFELLKKYQELCIEIQALRNENNRLKQKLGIYDEGEEPQEICFIDKEQDSKHVTRHSSVDEKIALFSSFFKGREDVYAKRWYSAKTKKSGYQPACENEWSPALCNKQKYKCSVCPNRKLSPFNREAIYKHLSGKDENGRDVVGLYPLLHDDTCYFLAVDFDGRDFTNEAIAFKNACNEYDIPAYIERSRSGEGAHVWIFFAEAISAATVRKLGSGLLTYAMNKQSSISFSSYDRLFPNQDTMPSGGFGNLIVLPLQGGARQKGNSVFVNEEFVPFIDQWAYLSTMRKMTVVEVERAIEQLCPYGELGNSSLRTKKRLSRGNPKRRRLLTKLISR